MPLPPGVRYPVPPERAPFATTGGTAVNFARFDNEASESVWALIIDTPDTRLVTFYEPAVLERVLRAGLAALGVLPDGLLLPTPEDLRTLGDGS